jgi:ubiquinone/menaquinone biosynthesis C-methylase UbiE/uncharacterized protein YbaR (Trm112 family)
MLSDLVKSLKDPDTASPNLSLEVFERSSSGDVAEGRVICQDDGQWFRIQRGILDFVPTPLRDEKRYCAFAARHGLKAVDRRSVSGKLDDQQKQIDFFREDSAVYDKDVSNLPFYRMFDHMYMDAWISQLPAKQSVLDLGGGTGRQALPLARAGHTVCCCDISEEMLGIAVRKAEHEGLRGNINFLLCNAENLPMAGNSFDSVICYGSMHHFASPGEAVRHASLVLKDGGKWFSIDPHDSPLRFVFDLAMKAKKLYDEVAADEKHFTGPQLSQLCADAGIVSKISYSTYVLPHMLQLLPYKLGYALLYTTDRMFQHLPGIKRCGGIVIVQGIKAH